LARLVAEKYKTRHHEIRISFKNLLNDIEKILYNYGEPFFDSSAIPSYYVSQAAKQHLTVVLNGDGGDEMFGGYRRYIPFTKYDFLKSGFLVKGFARTLSSMLPLPDNKKSIYSYVYRLADFAGKDGIDSYLSATIDSFEGLEKYLKAGSRLPADIQNDFNRINQSSLSGLHKIMNLDFDNILAGDLLVKMDIATMASSLEGRSPLLGKDILEYAPTLPDEYKIKGKTTKFILRKLAEKYLPGDLVNQPKRGFEIPLKKWVNNELKDMIVAYLFSANACNNNFVLPGFIKNIWDRKIKINEEKRAKIIWTFFALEVWYKKNFLEENAGIK
ncbi:MAG: asparagine synthase C-terminal domain-containing protein, partial [Bacteroidota bacterium]